MQTRAWRRSQKEAQPWLQIAEGFLLHLVRALRTLVSCWKKVACRKASPWRGHYPHRCNKAEDEGRRTSSWSPARSCLAFVWLARVPSSRLPAATGKRQEGDGQGTSCLNRAEASLTCGYDCRHSQVERVALLCSGCLCANIKHVLQLTCKECVSLKRICSPGEHKTQLRCLIVSHPPDRNNRRR